MSCTKCSLHLEGRYCVAAESQPQRSALHQERPLLRWLFLARQGKASEAVDALDEALNAAAGIQRRRNSALLDATSTWYKTWFSRVGEANGRRYLNQVDDVKDHRPVRTVDMSYLVHRELLYPLGDWAAG